FVPIIDGEIISEEQYDALPEEVKNAINKQSGEVQSQTAGILRRMRKFDRAVVTDVGNFEFSSALFAIGQRFVAIIEKYYNNPKVCEYVKKVKEDILENFDDFFEQEDDESSEMTSLMPWLVKKSPDEVFAKYKINLLVDNSTLTHAPVIVDLKPSHFELVGEVEYDSEYGNLTADFMKIKPGTLHRANGGFLIIPARDAFSVPHVYDALRKTLKTKQITTEPLREYMSVAVSYLKPESVPADVKIILVGDEETYSLINYYDDDFNKLFKVHAAFDYEMDSSEKNLNSIIHFIKNTAKERSLPPFNEYAVAALLEYLARLAERQDKLDSRLGKLRDVMEETAVWSKSDIITAADVTRAICERNYRSSLYEEKLSDLIDKNIVMIDTTGAKKAQINGLAVIDSGDYIFAKPSRITATAYAGKAGVVNIEKEAEMSGSIHDKGVEVITGFLGQKYAQEFPLSVSCRICFEQNYNGIDGDSASSTELYCILSSLADVPIKQSLAVTGSINQRGEIQPIGGVTYKIEGFFDLCEKRGLTGKQGVIIPRQNIHDLVLCDKVIDAVQKGVFHIYAIDHLDDGIQLLMNTPAGEKNDKGKYPSETIHGKVYRKLKDFFKKSVDEGY
ncbi:MAG: AAA family ATPase, partial [Clostridiales bacterium]|nr:AAA family ATPase [Clostridiales bacterium]